MFHVPEYTGRQKQGRKQQTAFLLYRYIGSPVFQQRGVKPDWQRSGQHKVPRYRWHEDKNMRAVQKTMEAGRYKRVKVN